MVKEGGEGSYDVPVLLIKDWARLMGSRPQEPDQQGWLTVFGKLLDCMSAMQQSKGGPDCRRVFATSFCAVHDGGSCYEVSPSAPKARWSDV